MDRLGGSKEADLHVSRLRMLYIATSARCQGMTSLVHRVRERVGFVPSTCSMSPDFGDGDKRCSNVHNAHEGQNHRGQSGPAKRYWSWNLKRGRGVCKL